MIQSLIDIVNDDSSLRPYQVNSKKQIYEAWLSVRSVLFQMPTGTGKTRLFSSIIKDVRSVSVQKTIIPQPRILVLAHRTELIEQISNTITNKYQITCGIIKSGILENMEALVQIASVQSLTRRLSRWAAVPFGIIIIDEAHHALAKTYLKICSAFPNAKMLGVTATPCRLNGESFRKIFDKLIVSQPVQKFIDMGYLSKFQYYSIKPHTSLQYELDNIRFFGTNGDYAERELMEICDKTQVRAQLIKSYNTYAKGKKGIVYTINKAHNMHVAKQYEDIGVSVATIDSDTPAEKRRQIVYDFRNGKYDIICNVNIFSEGFDCPDIEFIQLARPTLSLALYLQQVGRALRISDNKDYALILDNVGSYNKFGLPNKPLDWNRFFNGLRHIAPVLNNQKSVKPSKAQRKISEADEDMVLISESEIADNDIDLDALEYTIYDILATIEQFPIGVRDYLSRKEFDKLQAAGDQESISWHMAMLDLRCPHSTLESYTNDLYCQNSEEIEADDIADHMYYHTYLFNANGKYGVCRLKYGYDISNLEKEANNSSQAFSLHNYFDILLEPIYDNIDVPNSGDCFIAVKNGMYGVIDGSKLIEIIPFEYDDMYESGVISNYIAKKDYRAGVFDERGNIYIPFNYDDIYVSMENGKYICSKNGKYALFNGGKLVYRLNKKIEQLTKDLCVFCDNKDNYILYLTNNNGEILYPSGAREIFITNNANEICLEFLHHHLLLDTDLTLKSSLIDGLHPERKSILKKQREKRKIEKPQQCKTEIKPTNEAKLVPSIVEIKEEEPQIQKKKRPRIVRVIRD